MLVLFVLAVLPTVAMAQESQESIVVGLVVAELSNRINVPQNQIEIESVELQTWMDSGLGCRQPGFAYPPILTEGWLIILRVNDNLYHYHTDNDDDIRMVMCSIEGALGAVPLSVGLNNVFTHHLMMHSQYLHFISFAILFTITGMIYTIYPVKAVSEK